ncbi:MAG: hypothetical protein K8R21_06860 [Leptospira sp.]|nr:hypothetical protein [Leptospira sp.]
MNLEKNTNANPYQIILSVLLLSFCLSIFYSIKDNFLFPDSFNSLANLKSLTEDGKFHSPSEPLPVILLFVWKNISGLNYFPAYHSLAALLFAIFLHLTLLLFQRQTWKINHYLLVYLTGFLPFGFELPGLYFNELFCAIVVLTILLTFRMQYFYDLLIFTTLTIIAFLSGILMFILAYTCFVIKAGTIGIREQRARTSVFYKRKNIPGVILVSYLTFIFIILFCFGIFGFFGDNSFRFMFDYFGKISLRFGLPLITIFAGTYLLRSEKELNSIASSVVIVIVIFISGYFSFKSTHNKLNLEDLNAQKSAYLSLKGKGLITRDQAIYSDALFSNYIYFYAKEQLISTNLESMKPNDLLVLNGIWSADRIQIDKIFRSRRQIYFPLDSKSVLVRKEFIERINSVREDSQIKIKLSNTVESIKKISAYGKVKIFLMSLFSLENA